MAFNLRAVDLKTLRSLTKYPSIPTYHSLDNRGVPHGACLPFEGPVVCTEKVDGTNARIVLLPGGGYVIGSREEFLHARGDVIHNPALGIVEAIVSLADRLDATVDRGDRIEVYFGEVFGGNVTAHSKQYTGEKRVGFRLFDVLKIDHVDAWLARTPEHISSAREAGEIPFVSEEELSARSSAVDIPVTPRMLTLDGAALPRTVEETDAWLSAHMSESRVALDAGAGKRPEGLVLRSPDRKTLAKVRFEDYARLKRKKS